VILAHLLTNVSPTILAFQLDEVCFAMHACLRSTRASVRVRVLLMNVELWASARSSEHLQAIALMASHGLITSITASLNSLRIFDWCESVGPLAIGQAGWRRL
jgi:hypothetical protein